MFKLFRNLYLSILVFFLCFFGFYAVRYNVYDFLDSHDIYEETLSSNQIVAIKSLLNKHSLDDDTYIRQELKKITDASYHIYSFDGNNVLLNGRYPFEYKSKYILQIETKKYIFEWFPNFKNYLMAYDAFDVILSLLISILFYYLLKKDILFKKFNFHFRSLSLKMIITVIIATIMVILSYLLLTNYAQSICFDFISESFYEQENYEDIAQQINEKIKNINFKKKTRKQINQILKDYNVSHASYDVFNINDTFFIQQNYGIYDEKNLLSTYQNDLVLSYPLEYSFVLDFKNKDAVLYVTSYPLLDYVYAYYALSIIISFSFYIILMQNYIHNELVQIKKLRQDISNLALGNWNYPIESLSKDELGQLSNNIEQMRLAFLKIMDDQQKTKQANQELISSISHDLRTPLTALHGYLEIIALQKSDKDKQDRYIKRCIKDVDEIIELSNKMLEYSIAYSTEYHVNEIKIPISYIYQLIDEHIQYLRELDLKVEYHSIDSDDHILATDDFIHRILNNIFSNLQKYCDPWQPIIIDIDIVNNKLKMIFINQINKNLSKVESNGIGLKSTKKMVELLNGTFEKQQTSSSFKVILQFPIQ